MVEPIQTLIHHEDRAGGVVEKALESVTTTLAPSLLAVVARPLVRLAQSTGFKRLKQVCHEALAALHLDAESEVRAREVERLAKVCTDLQESLKESEKLGFVYNL